MQARGDSGLKYSVADSTGPSDSTPAQASRPFASLVDAFGGRKQVSRERLGRRPHRHPQQALVPLETKLHLDRYRTWVLLVATH
ncbi:MAG: hypothetical protein QOE91_2088 [Gaiellaceae bacterium]|nr:hypothetical protein [Gaiellaceae bacterium]